MSANITLNSPFLFWSANFGGPGKVSGTVTIAATGAPVARRVRLHDRRSGRLIRETWSAADGAYEFTHLKLGIEYVVYALDYTSTYDGVIADRVTAVLP